MPVERKLSRRMLIVGAVGGAAAVGAASVGLGTGDEKAYMIRLVQRALPGVTLEPESLSRFADDFMARETASSTSRLVKWRTAAAIDEVAGPSSVGALGLDDQIGKVQRRALTFLLENSNFFALDDPRSAPVVYARRTVCGIPFRD